ncbi:MAG: hypothetical protein WB626_08150 [Bacteroidota bacterium]
MILGAAVCLLLVGLGGERAEGPDRGERILERVEEQFAGIRDYAVTLDVTADVERLSVPPMKAVMYFKRPDRVRFVSEGFALLPREPLGFVLGNLRQKFAVESVREDSAGYQLVLLPRNDRTKLRRILATVDSARFLPVGVSSPQLDGRMMSAHLEYVRAAGFWVPSVMDVRFEGPEGGEDPPGQEPARRPGLPRKGRITVRYSGHRINTGLPDSLFTEPREP